MKLVNWFENLSKPLKLVLALPLVDESWMIYRIVNSIVKKDVASSILAIIFFFVAFPFMWIVDIITVLAINKVGWTYDVFKDKDEDEEKVKKASPKKEEVKKEKTPSNEDDE